MLTRSHLEICQSCSSNNSSAKILKSCSSNDSSANEKSFKDLSLAVVALIESCSKIYHSLSLVVELIIVV